MKVMLKDLGSLQVGYQAREAVRDDPKGSHWIIQMRNLLAHGLVDRATLARFEPDREPDPYTVYNGDVLLQVRGTVHRAGVVRDLPDPTLAANHFYILRPDTTRVIPEFVAWYLNQSTAQSQILKGAQSAGTVSIVPKAMFESIEVPIPSLDKQCHIVELDRLQWREKELTTQLQAKRAQCLYSFCMYIANGNQPEKRTTTQ